MKTKPIIKSLLAIGFALTLTACSNDEDPDKTDRNKTGETNGNYVEVCDIKWAKGNLLYNNGIWEIAGQQWITLTWSSTQVGLFNYGVTSTTKENFYDGLDDICGNPDYDIARNHLGEPWRLPSHNEFTILLARASRQYGYCKNENDTKIYGWLFTDNDGNQVINSTAREITAPELNKGLFLPNTGVRMATSSSIYHTDLGAYWTGNPLDDNPQRAWYLAGTSQQVSYTRLLRWEGLAVRPVYDR